MKFNFRRIEETQNDIRLSDYYEKAVDKLQSHLQLLERCETHKLICIGIGHFSECSISRHQLAFILLLKEKFGFTSIEFHEPILFRSEVNILKKLNCNIALENCEGKIKLNGSTLVYAPHCPKQLINNLLWKNWNANSLKQLIYIGNSFSNLLNSTPNRFLAIDAAFIVKLQPICHEIELENKFKFSDIFNDTSIHRFIAAERQPEEFWSKDCDEPVYESDNSELITTKLIEKLQI